MRLKTIPLLAAGAAALAFPAGAAASDRNHDSLPDRWEHQHHLSLSVNQARRDQDHDGLRNKAEYRLRTDPRSADTDRDGLDDGDEVRFGYDARNDDSDHDGKDDGEEVAGTVKSFDGGVLTLTLANGDTLAAKVTDATDVECEGADDSSARAQAASTGEDHGDDGEDRGGDSEDRSSCDATALKPGAKVHEAEVAAASTGSYFKEVKLVG